jgi:hypothetical protein
MTTTKAKGLVLLAAGYDPEDPDCDDCAVVYCDDQGRTTGYGLYHDSVEALAEVRDTLGEITVMTKRNLACHVNGVLRAVILPGTREPGAQNE